MPSGIYVGVDEETLLQYRREAYADLGRAVTGYSDSGTSVSKAFGIPPKERIMEINWALSKLDSSKYGAMHTSVQKDWRFRVDC